MKTIISCLVLVGCVALAQAGPVKRSIIVSAPVVTYAAAAPVAVKSVVHNPTTVVKTEQVHSGDQSSYSYSSEVRSNPAVVHHTVAAAPVVATTSHVVSAPVVASAPVVSSASYVVPSAYNYAYGSYYPYSNYGYYPYSYAYSPTAYLLAKKK